MKMKTISSYLMISLALLGAVACSNAGFKKTNSGLRYKIISDGQGPLVKVNQFVKMEISQKVRDSVSMSTYGSVPFYMRVDSPRATYNPTEILTKMRKGDSAITVLSVDTIREHNGGQLPPGMKRKDNIVITMKLLDIFPTQDLLMADRKAEMDKEQAREVKAVEKYLADSNIHATRTALGTFVVVKDPGTGPQVDSGKLVYIRYTAKLLPSGKVFESNMSGMGNEPLKFVVGQHAVIQGWDDGLKLFHEGGKGTLYVPSYLAYDQRPPAGHKPFENLIFDIAVDSVRPAPPPSRPRPGMPMPPNFQRGQLQMRPGARPPVPPAQAPKPSH